MGATHRNYYFSKINQTTKAPISYNATPLIQPRLNLHPPTLTLSKTVDNTTYILRLWQNTGQKQMMIGTLSQDVEPMQLFSLNNLTCSISRYNIDELPLHIKQIGVIKKTPEHTSDQNWQPYCWNGTILKIWVNIKESQTII